MILSMSLISLNHSLGKSQHVKHFNTLSLLHSPHVFHLDQSLFILILRQQMFKHLECKILHQRWCAEEESLLFFLQLSCTDFQPWMGLYPNPTAVVDNYFFFATEACSIPNSDRSLNRPLKGPRTMHTLTCALERSSPRLKMMSSKSRSCK